MLMLFFFFFFCCSCGKWKFLGQGLNLCHSSNLSHLKCWTTREVPNMPTLTEWITWATLPVAKI